ISATGSNVEAFKSTKTRSTSAGTASADRQIVKSVPSSCATPRTFPTKNKSSISAATFISETPAKIIMVGGVVMLLEYYKAARNGTALVEKDWDGIALLTGSERGSWLQGMVTNDVQKLTPGTGCYAAHLNPQGKVKAHMTILRDEDSLVLVLER